MTGFEDARRCPAGERWIKDGTPEATGARFAASEADQQAVDQHMLSVDPPARTRLRRIVQDPLHAIELLRPSVHFEITATDGFANVRTFDRAVRRGFGMSPGATTKNCERQAGNAVASPRNREWIEFGTPPQHQQRS